MLVGVKTRARKLTSLLTALALAIQVVLPGGLFNFGLSPAMAATNTYHFTTASSYSVGDDLTVADTYVSTNLLMSASADSMDSNGPTTDLVETDTAGRVLGAIGEYPDRKSVV